ncbi:MAG: hypothetical protein IKC80_04200, partial [Kiritimatiellae bacterium]|nr:hypothetical protein [Kiritimatiellia bacterium]
AFAYTLFLHDILPARAFLTDFLRTPGKTPAETAGVKLAVQKMLKKKEGEVTTAFCKIRR